MTSNKTQQGHDAKLQRIHADISDCLNKICALFDPKNTPKLTLIVRTPWLKDGGLLMGNDDCDEAIAEIQRLRIREPLEPLTRPAGTK